MEDHTKSLLEVWAKKNRVTDSRHPLLFHMFDTARVASAIWCKVLHQGYRSWITASFHLEENEQLMGRFLAFWAGIHDIGKASPPFQDEIPGRKPHGTITACVLCDLLINHFGYSPYLARRLATICGGHHGIFPRSGGTDLVSASELGGNKWARIRLDLVKALAEQFGLNSTTPPVKVADTPDHATSMALAGFISVADWIASNENFFAYAGITISADEYYHRTEPLAEAALQKLCWDRCAPPAEPKKMAELFAAIAKHGPHPVQNAAASLAKQSDPLGMVIIEAPTGEGKTEAAMYLADRWAMRLGQRGCYFALPTQATSNQMFGRVKAFLEKRYPDDIANLMLLHGYASLSAEFALLRERGDKLFDTSAITIENQEGIKGNVAAAEWFTHRKRGLLAPFGVGTVDQTLLAVLQTKHVFVRLFGLAHKTIIIDEVHAYDTYMSTLLERLLEWLAALGSTVVLLSATLPKQKHNALLAAYARGKGEKKLVQQNTAYPRISWVTGAATGTQHVETSKAGRKTIHLEWTENDLPVLGEKLRQSLAGGGCVAVVCNTVARAQKTYRALKPFFPGNDTEDGLPELDLLHARYLFCDRETREKRSLIRFGHPDAEVDGQSVRRPHRAVLVSTQIIEQSLDLDFDLMVTELAPADLILQRAGRLHRHKRIRPPGLERPTVWLFKPEGETNSVPHFGPSEYVYDAHILLRSWLALKECSAIAVPENVSALIEAVYDDRPCPENLEDALRTSFDESKVELLKLQRQSEAKAKECCILAPDHPDDIMEDFSRQLEEDNPNVHASIQALTRLSDPTVSVVFLHGNMERPLLDAQSKKAINLKQKPNTGIAVKLLKRSLTISHKAVTADIVRSGLRPTGWTRCALLRHHRLLFLDASLNVPDHFNGYDVRLDQDLGLLITRTK